MTAAPPARHAAGLAVVAALVAGGFAISEIVPSSSPLLWAMGLGVLVAPLVRSSASTAPGIGFASKHLLRAGVALLGLRISLSELADVGLAGVAVAAGTIVATMLLTVALARRLRVDPGLGLLIATGTAICGASAIAAMNTVTRSREEDVGYALAAVTVLGTAALLVLPPASAALGLGDTQAGMWAGGSIHEVAQATGAGAVVSAAALKVATLVKLCRVVMLAPVIAAVSARMPGREPGMVAVPGFVLAFLALVVVRSVADLPTWLLDAGAVTSTVLLAAGLAALGLRVRVRALRQAGARPFVLALGAWAVASATALLLILLLA